MANDKVLIFGGGYLGNRIRDHFGENALISTADITDLEAVKEAIQASQPHVVINAAAKTLTGELEKPENQAEGYQVNVQGAANIAYACREASVFMAHISTGMMFDGPDVREADTPQPTNYYAWTKAWADAQLVPLMGDKVMIARIHTPLSKHANPRNLLTKLQGFDKVVGEPSSLTVVEDFLAALEQLVEKRASGIYNVVNPGSISLY
ncbi:MAG: solute carrier family 35, er, partial [Patescibacteria group bacterium]|nr:solute carrier family 35, er [Patescibacteria group bacterium]